VASSKLVSSISGGYSLKCMATQDADVDPSLEGFVTIQNPPKHHKDAKLDVVISGPVHVNDLDNVTLYQHLFDNW
jgi:hypothetical protein